MGTSSGTETSPAPPAPDARLLRFRERVAALIAIVVVAAALSMLFLGFRQIAEPEKFGRAKDLLLIINPFLGVVIGYYFNKVSTEARAESAESTARHATADLRKATEERQEAQARAVAAKGDADGTRDALEGLSQAAEKMLAANPLRSAGTLSATDGGTTVDEARLELEAALARAKRRR